MHDIPHTFDEELEIFLRLRKFYRSAFSLDDPCRIDARRKVDGLAKVTEDLRREGKSSPTMLITGSLNFGMSVLPRSSTDPGSDIDFIYAGQIYVPTGQNVSYGLNKDIGGRLNDKLALFGSDTRSAASSSKPVAVSCLFAIDMSDVKLACSYIDAGGYHSKDSSPFIMQTLHSLKKFYHLAKSCTATSSESVIQVARIEDIASRHPFLRKELQEPYFRPLASELSVSFWSKYHPRLQERGIALPDAVKEDLGLLFGAYI